ncbi:MAG: relaxase MobL [Ruminococcus bromii]|nr:relaxase MobL [Ruminococcus bromii]
MGARFVINTRYFHIARPGEEFSNHALSGEHVKRLVEYCATRETVSLSYSLDKTAASRPATQKQIETIEELKQMVSDYKETLEYKDYAEAPTIKNASELISRLSELALLSSDSIGFNEVANLIEYAANRPGVVKVGEHGLFSSTRDIDLTKVAEEMSTYGGNIWTDILSLRREDASVCGYESQEPWRNLILSHIDKIAKAHHIKLENLCWYGAMHNTGCHPHVHLFVYSKDTKEGYLGKKDIKSLKSTLAPAIFKNELISTYQQKDNYLKDINLKTERLIQDLIENPEANFKNDSFQKISDNLLKLSQEYKGKAKYGFQPKEVKKLVNEIQTLMISNNEALNELYKCWCNEQLNIESLYINNPTSEYPIESNPSFTRMKNIIMEQAEMLRKNINPMNRNTFTEEMPVNRTNKSYDFKNTNNNRDNYKPSINKELNNYIKDYPEDIQIFESQTSEQIDSILIFENDNNSTKNFKALFQLANDLSTRNGEICRKLADCYYYGHGTDKNIDNAIMWYGISADSFQDSMASYKLGQINLHGCENIETDKTLGYFYCEQAFYLFKNEFENGKFFDRLLNGEKELFYSEKVSKSEAYKEYLMGLMFLKGDGLKKDFSNAYESLLLAATNGYTHANYYIGNMYYCGLGFEQSYENALNYYKKAAEKNDNYAKCKVAEMYINGKGTEKNINIAISWLESAAKSNNPDAAYQLGYIYSSENYGLSNEYKAKLYYLTALNNYIALEKRGTNQTAEYRIGMILLNGLDGNKRPIETALKWLNKAALNGNSSAAYQLGKIFEEKQEINNAVKYFEIASKLGNPYASFKLGNYSYENGDIEAAAKFYATASENNIANASFKLGKIFSMENNNLKSNEKSEFYYARALNQYIADFNEKPDGFSAYCIAWLYQNGKGIQANTEEAEKWYKRSSDYGNPDADYQLGYIYKDINKNELSKKHFAASLHKYIELFNENPNDYLAFKIGSFYQYGLGTEYDINKAVEWYKKSEELGNKKAAEKLEEIKKSQSLSASCVVTAACHFGRMINTETIAAAKNKIKTDSKVLKREKIQKIYAGQAFDDVEQSYDN